jgi:hypothetical protein
MGATAMNIVRLVLIGAAAGALHVAAHAADTAPATAARTVGNADPDKIICRKTLETGSLVRKKKECYTQAQWDQIYAAHREGNTKTRDQLSSGFNCMVGGGC